MSARSAIAINRLSSRRRARLAGWVGLFLLSLEIFLGTALPVARAAQSDRLIPIADLAVCTMDGMQAAVTEDGKTIPAEPSAFCAACLPLVQLLAPPAAPAFAQPSRIHAVGAVVSSRPWPQQAIALGFSARAPPLSV